MTKEPGSREKEKGDWRSGGKPWKGKKNDAAKENPGRERKITQHGKTRQGKKGTGAAPKNPDMEGR